MVHGGGRSGVQEIRAMFDLDRFLEDCRRAVQGPDGAKAVRDLLAEAVSDPAALLGAIGEPTRAGLTTLYRSDTLTVLNLAWGPYMSLSPHDHGIWAAIGIYGGREDNIFWRRIEEPGKPSRVEAAGAKSLSAGDVAPLGKDIVHSVLNPIGKITGAIHIYGGDFFHPHRHEWDPETLREGPYDVGRTMRKFEESNAALGCMRAA
jgi:predicted metal-dependent enzyme (double-stranded beta helix superfamily)